MRIAIIAAVGMRNELGKDGKLPWSIKEDLKHFRTITMGQTVVMGRKTYESLPSKLDGRDIIVLTTQPNYDPMDDDVKVMNYVSEVIKYAYENDIETLYVAGGGEIYKHFLPSADMLYLTRVGKEFDADAFFPEINFSEWKIAYLSDVKKQNEYMYLFQVLTRRG